MNMPQRYITHEECNKKVHIPKWALGLFFTIFIAVMGLFLTLVGYSAMSASSAAASSVDSNVKMEAALEKSEEVAHTLTTHIAVKKVEERNIYEKLEDIRKELHEARQENKIIITKLLEMEARHHTASGSE